MVRQRRHHKQPFPAITCTLFLAVTCLITLLFTACGTEEASPTPMASTQSPVKTTPSPEEFTPTPNKTEPVPEKTMPATQEVTSVKYPWKSILARGDVRYLKKQISPNMPSVTTRVQVVEVSIDLGREYSTSEMNSLKNTVWQEVKLIDEDGKEYKPFSGAEATGVQIIVKDSKSGEMVSFQADFAYIVQYDVKSKTCVYTLNWPGYPPLDIGNPFETPFSFESG